MNRNFGKLKDGALEYAPSVPTETVVDEDGEEAKAYIVAPTAKDYRRLGWRPVHELVENPPAPPRTFSKLKLYAALSAANLWDALRSWLERQTYEGMNAWTAFSLAQDLTEDHPMFGAWFAAAKAELGVDDATAEAILASSVSPH